MNKFIVLLIGKSGSGKTSVCEQFEKQFDWKALRSYTTRPKRNEDEDGHVFITDEEFDQLDNICAFTIFDGARYCATQEQVDQSDIYVIDLDGLDYFKRLYKGDKSIIPIYLDIDTHTQYERMRKRGDSRLRAIGRVMHDRKAFRNAEYRSDLIHINAMDDLSIVVANVYKAAIMAASLSWIK